MTNKKVNMDKARDTRLTETLRPVVKKTFFPVLLFLCLVAIFFSGGLRMGNPELFNSFFYEPVYTESGSTLVGGEEVNTAEAAGWRSGNFNSSGTVNMGTAAFNGSKEWGTSLNSMWFNGDFRHSHYYTGNDHGFSKSAGQGWFKVVGRNNKQKICADIGVEYFDLTGTLQQLAQKKLLQVKMSATIYARTGYDQALWMGLQVGQVDPNVGESMGQFASYAHVRNTNGDGQSKSWTSGWVSLNGNTKVSVGMMGRSSYGTFIGGRYPAVELKNITLTFKSLDNTAPSLTITASNPTVWEKTKNVTVKADDNGQSGVNGNTMVIRRDSHSGALLTNTKGANVTVPNVTTSVYATIKDNTGNQRQLSKLPNDLKIDQNAPTISGLTFINSSGGAQSLVTRDKVRLRFTVSDAQSGVTTGNVSVVNVQTGEKAIQVAISGNDNSRTYTVELPSNGQYKVSVTDGVGFTATQTTGSMMLYDATAPVLSIIDWTSGKTPTGYALDAVSITFRVVDKAGTGSDPSSVCNLAGYWALRGVNELTFAYPNSSNANVVITPGQTSTNVNTGEWISEFTVTFPLSGVYRPSFTDKAGNATSTIADVGAEIQVYIDTNAPNIASKNINPILWTNGDVRVQVGVNDMSSSLLFTNGSANNGSGLDRIELRNAATGVLLDTYVFGAGMMSGTATFIITANYASIGQYKLIAYDKAGNSTEMVTQNKTINGKGFNPYFINENTASDKVFTAYIDKEVPILTIYASRNGAAYAPLDTTYTLPWARSATVKFALKLKFGASGGSLSILINGTQTPLTTYASADIGGTTDYRNEKWLEYTYSGEGITSYQFKFNNGAGTEALSGTLVARLDTKGPNVQLLGFGSGIKISNFATADDVSGAINEYISESDMSKIAWRSPGNVRYAYFVVSDGDSGLLKEAQSNSQGTQSSQAKAIVTFTHNGYSYKATYPYQYSGLTVLTVDMWKLDLIGSATNSAGATLKKADGTPEGMYDILAGSNTMLTYTVELYDFVGNTSKAFKTGGSSNLEYKVDPFNVGGEVVSIKTEDNKDYTGSWTRQKVTITIKKKIGLTPALAYYGVKNITDNPDGSTDVPSGAVEMTSAFTSDSGTSRTATLTLDALSRRVEVYLRVASDAFEMTWSRFAGSEIRVRQDTEAAIVEDILLSAKKVSSKEELFDSSGNITADVLVHFDYVWVDGKPTVIRRTNNGSGVVWSHQKVYIYIIAVDKFGETGFGSGVKSVTINRGGTLDTMLFESDNLVSYDRVDGLTIFRSDLTYGYGTANEEYSMAMTVTDNLDMERPITILKDSDGQKMLPAVDEKIPVVSISSAKYVDNGDKSYLGTDGRFTGKTIKSNLRIEFYYAVGASDAKIYVRQREIGTDLPTDSAILLNNSDRPQTKYGFVNMAGIDLSEWTYIDNHPGAGNTEGKIWSYEVSNTETVFARYDILIVSGTNVYYYMDGGDVFIDNIAPVIDEAMTFYTLSNTSNPTNANGTIDFDTLKKFDINQYTNDDVYVYFMVTDAASGVDKVVVGGVALEQVTVRRSVNGEYKDVPYYRLKMTQNVTYKTEAMDKAGNLLVHSGVTPKIDKTVPSVKVTITPSSGSYDHALTSTGFTSAEYLTVRLTAEYGGSGFLKMLYATGKDGNAELGAPLSDLIGNLQWVILTTNSRSVTFQIAREQLEFYNFCLFNNITEENALNGTIPTGKNSIRVAIDRTAPEAYPADAESNIQDMETVWHAKGKVPVLKAADAYSYGSGIKTVKLDYSLKNVAQDGIYFRLDSDGLYRPYDAEGNAFTLDHYVKYTITMTDYALNESKLVILPRIDKGTPTFGNFANTDEILQLWTRTATDDRETLDEVRYTADTWTKMNVDALTNIIYGISGAKLEVARATGNSGGYGQWQSTGTNVDWGVDVPAVADGEVLRTLGNVSFLMSVAYGSNADYRYKLRLVNAAGTQSAELELGRIKIDKEKPEIEGTVKINNNTTNFGTVVANGTNLTEWTGSNLTMNLSTKSGLVSGYSFYYNISQGNANWKEVTNGFVNNADFKLDYGNKKFTHEVRDSVIEHTYTYYIMSRSGMKSDVYTVTGIKVDKGTPVAAYAAKTTYAKYASGGGIKEGTEGDYISANDVYNLKTAPWTNANAVVIDVRITGLTPSGMKVYINNELKKEIPYKAGVNAENPMHLYYVVTETGNVTFKLINGAGSEKIEVGNVKIDNSIPIIYVAGIRGTQSTNWDGSADNSWYISETKVSFVVGQLATDGAGGYTYDGSAPASDYTIEYVINPTGEASKWVWSDNGKSSVLNIMGNPSISGRYYFRIKSGSGMTYMLGNSAMNNQNQTAKTSDEMKAIIASNGGVINHLGTTDFEYNINVDSNVYRLSLEQLLEMTVNERDILVKSTDFGAYTVEKFINGVYVPSDLTGNYYRGDKIRIGYTGKDYLHRYSEYGKYDGEVFSSTGRYDSTDLTEENGTFEFRFVDHSYHVRSYYLKELTVTYGNNVLYKQTDNTAKVTAVTRFSYKNEAGAQDTVSIPLVMTYEDMDGNAVDITNLKLGGYVVRVEVEGKNSVSFRLKNAATVLLVKYFAEKTDGSGNEVANSETNPYEIRNAEDMKYLEESYFKTYTERDGQFELNGHTSYLTGAFTLKEDLTITDNFTIDGQFTGRFDGENRTITLNFGRVTGDVGLFSELKGTVKNLILTAPQEIGVHDGENVGLLASVITGGTVTNVRAEGVFAVASMRQDGALGGIAGRVSNATLTSIYVNAKLDNFGNRIEKASFGGIAGYLGTGAKLMTTYTNAMITLYNVGAEVKVGAVFGQADESGMTDAGEYFFGNRYLGDNVFVNDRVQSGFTHGTTGINDAGETSNTVRKLTYKQFIGTNTSTDVGQVNIAGKSIRFSILDRVYADFGLTDTDNTYGYGTGNTDNPLLLTTVIQLERVSDYVNLSYKVTEDMDLSGLTQSLALHRSFNGQFDGGMKKFSNLGLSMTTGDGDRIGLFAEVRGKVGNMVMTDVQISVEYIGDLYGGVVTAVLTGGMVHNVIMIGNANFDVGDGTLQAGSIAGKAEGGIVVDVMNIVNIDGSGKDTTVGGIVGEGTDVRLASFDNALGASTDGGVFNLGRVNVTNTTFNVGSVLGGGTLTSTSGNNVYAVQMNTYSNGALSTREVAGVNAVNFESTAMRNATFSNGLNPFNKVFKTDGLYYLSGMGTTNEKFIVKSEEDFQKIDHMLFASYNVSSDITFSSFQTIGKDLIFSGRIDGKNADSIGAEDGTVSSLMNVTDALVYKNAGFISDLGVNVVYEKTLNGEDLIYGAVAVINSTGTIRNVTVSGTIDIRSQNKDTTVVVSGFVGISEGGLITGDSKVQNSISGLEITVDNAMTVYAGGFIGKVDVGVTTINFGIASGTLNVTNSGTVYAGTLVGAANTTCNYASIEGGDEYLYQVFVEESEITDLFGYIA